MTAGDRPLVVYGDGPDGPLVDPRSLRAVQALQDPEILFGWVVRTPGWLDEVAMPLTTVLTGVGLRAAVGRGRVRSVPARLSAMPAHLAGRLRPDVAVVGAVEDGRTWRSLGSVGWTPAAAATARDVVIERWTGLAPLAGAPQILGNVVDVVDRVDPPDPPQNVRPDATERVIGGLVASLVPAGATVQWGPGALGSAFVSALSVPVAVHSGVVTDELVGLVDSGLLIGTAETAYLWGGPPLRHLVDAGRIRLAPVTETHDLTRLGRIRGLVAVNTALEVGLDGSVNVERVGTTVVSGPGGHPDFCLAASRSSGGLSIIAVRSSARGRSSIVVAPATVSTPRTDVDIVVTEYGIADLRGLTDRERALALVAVASPAHRDGLRAEVSG